MDSTNDSQAAQQLQKGLKRWKFQLMKNPAFPRQALDAKLHTTLQSQGSRGVDPFSRASQASFGTQSSCSTLTRHGSELLDCQVGVLETAAELLVKSLQNCNVPQHLVNQIADVFHTAANLAVSVQVQQKHPKPSTPSEDMGWTSSLTLEPLAFGYLDRNGSSMSNSGSNSNTNIVGLSESHCGGWEVLMSVAVDGMFRRCFHDERIKRFFVGQDKTKLTKHMCGFLSCALGTHNDKEPYDATYVWDIHRSVIQNMDVEPSHVDVMCEHLRSTLTSMGIQDDIIEEAVQVLQSYRWIFACRERPGTGPTENGSKSPFSLVGRVATLPPKNGNSKSSLYHSRLSDVEYVPDSDDGPPVGSVEPDDFLVNAEEFIPFVKPNYSPCPFAVRHHSSNSSLDRFNHITNLDETPQPWW